MSFGMFITYMLDFLINGLLYTVLTWLGKLLGMQ